MVISALACHSDMGDRQGQVLLNDSKAQVRTKLGLQGKVLDEEFFKFEVGFFYANCFRTWIK